MEQNDLLIIKYLSGNTSSEEQEILLKWLEEKEENRQYFRSLKDAYDLGHLESDIQASHTKEQWNKLAKTIPALRPTLSWKKTAYSFMRYAAVFILGILCLQLFHLSYNKVMDDMLATTTQIETNVGDRTKITLPDGSTVWLNACSSLTYDNTFGKSNRPVSLHGEAYFEVKTDTAKPFLVQADKFTYRVTGTSFNVYSFDDEQEMSIALLEGGVTVEYDSHAEKLSPGEMLTYNKETGKLSRKKMDVNLVSSWRYGEFVFDEMTFEELANRLERSYEVKFVFENDNMRNETFGGTLRSYDSLETIMKVIKTSIPVKYQIEENIVYIK